MSSITVKVFKNYTAERKYVLDVLFEEFLGLTYQLEWHTDKHWQVEFEDKKVIFPDLFFGEQSEDRALSYKDASQLEFRESCNTFCMFGEEGVEKEEGQLRFKADFIASAFVLLSRLEENESPLEDRFGRFPTAELLVKKAGLEKRALVNEYLEVLWTSLRELGFSGKRAERTYQLNLSHDVDQFRRYDSSGKLIRALGGDLIRRKSVGAFLKTVKRVLAVRAGRAKDPYDTFEFIMDVSEQNKIKSCFYFMCMESGEFDWRYNIADPKVQAEVDRILQRGHKVGIHPGWDTFLDEARMQEELKRARKAYPKLREGRQHYLKFRFPETLNLLENELETDSSMGFDSGYGFRSSVCYPYPLYHFQERRKSTLIEHPLVVMDTALGHVSEPADFRKACLEMKSEVLKYQGELVLLWHPNNLWVHEWSKIGSIYSDLIGELSTTA